jgi:hypothetical protein
MALSFEESKRMAAEMAAKAEPVALQAEAAPMAAVVDMPQAQANDDGGYTRSEKYLWYSQYNDDAFSTIDEMKNVVMDETQINITQETNSQVIPFKMPRRYDGIDLMQMMLQVHYLNVDGQEAYATPINVTYNEDTIRFYWLVTNSVTSKKGTVRFEITATGVNERSETYMWRTRPDGELNILEALSGTKMVEPDNDWYTSFVALMDEKVGQASSYASAAQASAQDAANAAAGVDNKIQNAAAGIKQELQSDLDTNYTKKTELTTELAKYYNKEEVDSFVTLLEGKISGIDGLAAFNCAYDAGTRALTFYNGDAVIKTVTLSTDPSAEWTTAYGKTVDAKISAAVNPVSTALDEYKTSNNEAVKALQDSVGDLPNTLQSDYYNKEATNKLLADKADKTALDGFTNDLTVTKNTVTALQGSVDTANSDIAEIQEKIKDIKPSNGHEYDITYTSDDGHLSLLEDGTTKTVVTIKGGGGGGGEATSTITIERIGDSSLTVVQGDSALISFKFTSVDNAGDDTGNATGNWYVGNTKVATTTITQGKNTFDVTQYLHSGDNTVRLQVTDSMGSVGSKNWSVNVVEFYLESIFDDSLFYSGEVTYRFTPYGNIAKNISFKLDGKAIGGTSTAVTGRQMTYNLPAQKHGSHLLEVSMTAEINGKQVTSNTLRHDIMWVEEGNNTPIISCAVLDYSAKQYSNVAISYTVYDPASSNTNVTLAVDGIVASKLTVGRTKQTWTYKSSEIGSHVLTITCGETVKTINAKITELGINIEPVKTNLMFDFNPAGRTNADENRLWTDGNTAMTVSDNFDWSNGGYQIDEDGDTYFCVKAGTTATLDYKLFADDAKKKGKNFKLVFKTTNVRDYDATALTCANGNVGLTVQAQKITLTSQQNRIELPICEDDFLEFEFNILPDSKYKEMVLWCDGIPCKVELYDASDNFTQASPVGITIGSADCDVQVYRMKTYGMELSDDEILDNFIADAKNAELMIERYNRNDITNVSGELDADLLAEKCPDLRIIKISAPTFTTGKKNEVFNTTIQQIYKNGRAVEDNWTATGSHKGQGTSSNAYGESGRNIDINCSGGFTFGDDSAGSTYTLTENSIPEKYFNIKVNIASSENANNACIADDYNTFNPYTRKAKKENPKVRDTMAFYPCVVFIQETDVENATVFKDGQWHFYACGDIGNSKKNNDTQGMDPENHKEVIVEIDNNTDAQTRFLSDDLSQETWDGDHSFEFRYISKKCTEEETQAAKNAWQSLLTWVVNADDEEFKTHFEDHFIKDSVLFYYLFTERHTMVDNRAKNVFPHTEDLIHWDFCMDYDNDTCQGNDNEGGLTLTYGYEDTDTIGTKSVFNAADSKLWCKVRDLFADDLQKMYLNRESALAWSANRILRKIEAYQDVKPEKLWIMDMRRKYFRTYEDNGTTNYLPMMHGNKRHQRRQYQKYQEKYIASKYSGTTCTADDMTIRGYTPTNWTGVQPDGTFHIRPYADTYVSVLYGSNPVKMRGKRGQTYTIECPIAAMNDTEVYVYNASLIQSIGDISGFYPGYVDFSHGAKLTDLKVGNGTEGYRNTNMTDFAVGNNTLLEHLNLQNVPNLKKSISLAGCVNLIDFYAGGSGITGVAFAKGGKIEKAELPAIASLTAQNLNHLTNLKIDGYENLTTLVVESCPTIDLKAMLEKCTGLNRVRLTGLDWECEDTALLDRLYTMTGLDENGYNTEHSVLEGKVHVPIMREKKLAEFNAQWPDLKISYNTLVEQFTWTFVNDDDEHTVLDVQYIDKGGKAVDPVTRAEKPIPKPTKKSTVSTDFTYAGWDTEFVTVFTNQTVTAKYTESVRKYTVRYLNNGAEKQKTVAPYGSMVLYEGDTPTYTAEEGAYKFYLFDHWDKGGYVNGDKDINAVYDSCEYTSGYFDGKEIGSLRPVEIYAMKKVGMENKVVSPKDAVTITMGNDFSYSDIEEKVLINEKKIFDGTNYVDTGVQLLKEDRDWVLAVDYRMTTTDTANAVLMQCFETNGMNGIRIWNNNGAKISWGTESATAATVGTRDMVVMRHKKGENNLHVYTANIYGDDIVYTEINRGRITQTNATLVFGCAKADDGEYERFAKGDVYWAKVWYADLGDNACRKLAAWPHETREYEMCGFKQFYLSDNTNKRCAMTFLAKNTLARKMPITSSYYNNGGWPAATLRTYLDKRLPNALPIGWQQLIQKVKVTSSAGGTSKEIVTADCYFFIPAAYELNPSMNSEPYIYEGTTISYMTDNQSRICYDDDGAATTYWTRSPNVQYADYFLQVAADGQIYSYVTPNEQHGVRVMFSV